MVITGLTRNQFVPKAHEGSNPSLCAKNKGHSVWVSFVFYLEEEDSRTAMNVAGFAFEPQSASSLLVSDKAKNLHLW